MHICKESRWVLFNLLDLEPSTGVLARGSIEHTSLERSSKTAGRDAVVLTRDWLGVREGKTWWARLALGGLVNVGGRVGGGLVFAAEILELDVVADGVEFAVNAEIVVADAAFETAGEAGWGS